MQNLQLHLRPLPLTPPWSGEGVRGRGLMDFFYNGKEMPNETLLLAWFKGMPCLLTLPKKRSVPSVMLKCLAWRLPTIRLERRCW